MEFSVFTKISAFGISRFEYWELVTFSVNIGIDILGDAETFGQIPIFDAALLESQSFTLMCSNVLKEAIKLTTCLQRKDIIYKSSVTNMATVRNLML